VNPGQRFVIDETVLKLYPKLSAIITPSTGSNHIKKEVCQQRDIRVYTLLDDRVTLNSISASAEFTFLLLLNTLRRLDVAQQEVSEGRWREREDMLRGHELYGKQVGLVGLGRIGQRLARWCTAFDARVAYYDPYVKNPAYACWPLEKIFSDSDAVCVCCLLTPETKGMIDQSLLQRLKPGASFINTSRGEVLCERDLVQVLRKRTDLRVALDVLTGEVTDTHLTSPLIEMHQRGQIIISPHIAGATFESQTKAAIGALNLLKFHQAGLDIPSV
jgi:phosphoglycerate dehydrogenase-like enzyme